MVRQPAPGIPGQDGRVSRRRSRLRPRVESRGTAVRATAGARVVAIVVALGISALFVAAQPRVGLSLFGMAWTSTFGSALGTTQVIKLATPLIIAGCGAAVAQRVGLWNLGIHGQMIFGAWLATAVAYALPSLPGPVLVPVLLVAGFAGGVLWVLVPALLRAYLAVNEVITTLMSSIVAGLWLVYWATGPWVDFVRSSAGGLFSRPIPDAARFPQWTVGSVTVGLAFGLAIVLCVVFWLMFRYTHYGYRTVLTGAGETTAAYAGINVPRTLLSVLLLSGGMSGVAGAVLLMDQVGSFSSPLTVDNAGWIAIVVALLAGNSLIGALPMGLLMAFVVASGSGLQIAGVPSSIVFFLTGMLVLISACADVLGRYRILLRPPAAATPARADPRPLARHVTRAAAPDGSAR